MLCSQDKSSPLEVVTAQDPRFQNQVRAAKYCAFDCPLLGSPCTLDCDVCVCSPQVELAVRFGKTLFITEVDNVDPMLFSLVRKDLANQGPRQTVMIGDKSVDYNEKFRLFFATRNPHVRLGCCGSAAVLCGLVSVLSLRHSTLK